MLTTLGMVVVLALLTPTSGSAQNAGPPPLGATSVVTDGPAVLVQRLEAALARSDAGGFARLFASRVAADQIQAFSAQTVFPGVTRAVVRERDRASSGNAAAPQRARLIVEVFLERAREARIATYRLDVARVSPPSTTAGGDWLIEDQELLSSVEGLFRLELNASKQFTVRDLSITAEDMVLSFSSGTAFVAETRAGVSSLVVTGVGQMQFTPEPEWERGQLRIFCGAEQLVASITTAFVRLNPQEFAQRVEQRALVAQAVNPKELARAQRIFTEGITAAYALDLGEYSRETWSLIPAIGDFLADIRTRKYGTLTFSTVVNEPEGVQLFDRKRKRTISAYPSRGVRNTRGSAFDEDRLTEYDILDYDIDASFSPKQMWLDGQVRVQLRSRREVLPTITLRLHEDLVLQSVSSDEQGRLLAIRVRGQNSFIVNLPTPLKRDQVMELRVLYAGRVTVVEPDREVVATVGQPAGVPLVEPEPRYLMSNRSYWYPQGSVTDFATGRLRLTVPQPFVSLASGSPAEGNPRNLAPSETNALPLSISEFVAGQPVRYFSWAVAELIHVEDRSIAVPEPEETREPRPESTDVSAGVRYRGLDLTIVANPRHVRRGRNMGTLVETIIRFYSGVVDDIPFPSLTLALVDDDLPGGHSPAYFALVHQPLPTGLFVWRNDPVNFDTFPDFFVAHELAHQYWGQAVGWKSYHEQWISEGFAQYFAALFAETRQPKSIFSAVLRRMRQSVLANESQGPIFLGYRLGHLEGNSRVFRAIVYNKGALVLHMLRRLLGDERFFRGLRQLYWASRFDKIGTDEVRAAFETVSDIPLDTYFEHWVYASTLPTIRWSWHAVAGPAAGTTVAPAGSVALRFEQQTAERVFVLPVTVTLKYADGTSEEAVVRITKGTEDVVLPTRSAVRSVAVNDDDGSLGRFVSR